VLSAHRVHTGVGVLHTFLTRVDSPSNRRRSVRPAVSERRFHASVTDCMFRAVRESQLLTVIMSLLEEIYRVIYDDSRLYAVYTIE